MSEKGKYPPRRPVPGPNDPPEDLSREEATYQREKEWLERDHLGKIAVISGDDLLGVFETLSDGVLETYRRFGDIHAIYRKIEKDDGPIFMPLADINHPSMRKRQ